MTESQSNIYKEHHQTNRQIGFSIMKEERGALLEKLVGKGKKVLDIGCRDGALTKFFTPGNQVLGVDIDDTALSRTRELGIETMKMDLHGDWVELGGRKFDVVVAGEVLEHLYHPGKIAQKAREVLTESGVFVGSVPNAFSLKNRLRYLKGSKRYTPLSDPTHINQFSASDLEIILKKVFPEVEILGLGRYQKLADLSPNLFAFDLFFVCQK